MLTRLALLIAALAVLAVPLAALTYDWYTYDPVAECERVGGYRCGTSDASW